MNMQGVRNMIDRTEAVQYNPTLGIPSSVLNFGTRDNVKVDLSTAVDTL